MLQNIRFNNLKCLYVIATLLIVSCNTESIDTVEAPKTLNSSERLNVAYGADSEQVYDIYLPKNRTLNTKVIILLHGGGWVSGDKQDMNQFKNYLREQLPDIAVVNLNYRLANENRLPFPMQINDITSAITHLHANASDYVISNTIGFIGVSAGAHLSMLWSYNFDSKFNTTMVCSIVGPTNLNDPAYTDTPNSNIKNYINALGITPSSALLQSISPINKVTINAPATILFYGGNDPLIPSNQGIELKNKLDAFNVTNQYIFYPNEGHGWVGNNLIDTTIKLKAFIELHL